MYCAAGMGLPALRSRIAQYGGGVAAAGYADRACANMRAGKRLVIATISAANGRRLPPQSLAGARQLSRRQKGRSASMSIS